MSYGQDTRDAFTLGETCPLLPGLNCSREGIETQVLFRAGLLAPFTACSFGNWESQVNVFTPQIPAALVGRSQENKAPIGVLFVLM